MSTRGHVTHLVRFFMATHDPRPHVALSLFVVSAFFGATLVPPTPISTVFGENWRESARTDIN
jgi:hypothetical protein